MLRRGMCLSSLIRISWSTTRKHWGFEAAHYGLEIVYEDMTQILNETKLYRNEVGSRTKRHVNRPFCTLCLHFFVLLLTGYTKYTFLLSALNYSEN